MEHKAVRSWVLHQEGEEPELFAPVLKAAVAHLAEPVLAAVHPPEAAALLSEEVAPSR